MKAELRFLLVGMVLVVFSEPTLAADIALKGARSCGAWVESREREKAGAIGDSGDTWLLGYLSGLSVATGKNFWGEKGVDLIDNASVYLWVDNYCRVNPLKSLADAGRILFLERTKGK